MLILVCMLGDFTMPALDGLPLLDEGMAVLEPTIVLAVLKWS